MLMISSPFVVKIENEINKQLSTLYRHLLIHTIFFLHSIRYIPDWSGTQREAKNDLNLLIFLPLPPEIWITGIQLHTHFSLGL